MSEERTRSRRSFLVSGISAVSGIGAFQWLRTRREDDSVPWPLRRVLEFNEQLSAKVLQQRTSCSGVSRGKGTNAAGERPGRFGRGPDDDSWKLKVLSPTEQETIEFTLADIKSLPRVEMVTELYCIEGWSQVVHWAGARFSSLAEKAGYEIRVMSA